MPKPRPPDSKPFDIDAELPEDVAAAAFRSGGYPFDKKMKAEAYDDAMRLLQIEMQKALGWVKDRGERVVLVFEGRDAAGKGGAIARLTQQLNPRSVRVVALSVPTKTEAGQWYFQRYAAHLPTKGEIVIYDRSWYNRAGVERVFDFCTPEETGAFLREAPSFEGMLARDGVRIFKIFLSIGREMQMKRLRARWVDPLNHWKITPIDARAIEKWADYSTAFEAMIATTDRPEAPWTVILGNDKLRARLAVMRTVLTALPYTEDKPAVTATDPRIVLRGAEFLRRGGEE